MKRLPLFQLALTLILVAGCADPTPELSHGDIHLAIRGGPVDGIEGMRVEILNRAGATIASRDVPLLSQSLPPSQLPDAGGEHDFTDAYFVVPAGPNTVRVTPLDVRGLPNSLCRPGTAAVEVVARHTTEVVVIAQCQGGQNGGIDVVAVPNQAPSINNLSFQPAKFVRPCEKLQIQADATDPDNDPVTYRFSVLTTPPAADYDFNSTGNVLDFAARTAGDYSAEVTACDSLGGCTSLSFPIHVAGNNDLCPPPGPTRSGMTWGVFTDRTLPAGYQIVGCGGRPLISGGCNPYQGDTACSTRLPVLCLNVTGTPRPPGLTVLPVTGGALPPEYYQGWAEGNDAITAPVAGTSLTSRAAADALCAATFGAGWRMAEFHDGHVDAVGQSGGPPGGWNFFASGNVASTSRFWTAINDQRANCWDP